MQLASLTFLYLFLPGSLILYFLFPKRLRFYALLGISLLFYFLADPTHLPLILGSVLFDYLMGRWMERFETKNGKRKAIMLTMVAKNLLLLIGISSYCQLKGQTAPLGLPVFTLLGLGYGVDIYNGEALYEHNLGHFLLSHLLFMKLPVGPLIRYRSIKEQLVPKKMDLVSMGEGAVLLIQGVAKQVVIGIPMQQMYAALSDFSRWEHSVLSLWLMPLCAAMSLYFTLSGYCDMARGLGRLFGLDLPRNFYYPYQSRSITDFVGRFHISVTDYLKAYLYRPLGEDSGGTISATLNIGLVTLLWSIWFGFRINYLLWGGYLLLFILLERKVWGRFMPKIPAFFLRIYTFGLVLLSFVIFNGHSIGQSLFFFGGMLGLGGLSLTTSPALYLASQYGPYLILAVVFCTSLPHSIKILTRKKNPIFASISTVLGYGFLLLLVTGLMLHP